MMMNGQLSWTKCQKSTTNCLAKRNAYNVLVSKRQFISFIRIKRDSRRMCLSALLWKIVHKNLQNLRNNGYVLHLAKDKRLEAITFKEKRYVSFVQGHKDKEYKHYNNFSDDERATFLDKMAKINNTLFKECEECYGIKTPIYLDVDKQMKRSKLTRKELATVLSHNATVQNQLGLTCTYCSCEGYMQTENFHCHRFDCQHCEPNNFCNKCTSLTVRDETSFI